MILASASPRRIEIFQNHGYDPLVIPSDTDEHIPFSMTPAETAMFLALQKGLCVLQRLCKNESCPVLKADGHDLIVSADTIVVCDDEILGKPASEAEAASMIRKLSGRSHHVLTGVCVIHLTVNDPCDPYSLPPLRCFYESTEVFFRDIPEKELADYVKTDEPYDKAGGYAVQGTFSKYAERICGDLENVIGFPFERFSMECAL